MQWSDMATDWGSILGRIKARFPNVDDEMTAVDPLDRTGFEAYLAQKHDLTLTEAREELNDFLMVEQLAREAFDFRARA